MPKVTFSESGFYGEVVDIQDNRCSAAYLRRQIREPSNRELNEGVDYAVVVCGLPKKRARHERERSLSEARRINRRLWLLIKRKEGRN